MNTTMPKPISQTDPDTDTAVLARLMHGHPAGAASLVQVLRDIQAHWHHIPERAIDALVQQWGLSRATIRGVVDFYHFLSLTPRGRYTLYLSDSVTDRMQGSEAVLQRLCERLQIVPEQTRRDGRVSLHRTACTGLCDQGPAGLINGLPLTRLDLARADAVADLIESDTPLADWPPAFFEVHNPIWRRDLLLEHPIAPGQALHWFLQQPDGASAMITRLRDAGLRGRGGAGFPSWQKWQACRQAVGAKAITCNADEGEPGTFKDRLLLMAWAHELLEGMTLAALSTGATTGFLYVRGEYAFMAAHLQQVLDSRRQQGLLGQDILGSGRAFDIALHWGAGAYVCGEETALIESIEGSRGVPRTRPPFPVERGYLGMPTVNNNVETFVKAAQIAVHGPAWLQSRGTAQSAGTRLLSVSGDVAQPGIYEVPWGIRLDAVLVMCGATDVQAVLVGGPSGHLVEASQLQRTLAFEDLPTGGAFTVFDRRRDLLEVARQYTHFFAQESCGFCTPCRVGCVQLVDTAERLVTGHASSDDLDRLAETAGLMRRTSHCGLGQTAANPLMDLIRHFPVQVRARLAPAQAAFDLDAATVDMHALRVRSEQRPHHG